MATENDEQAFLSAILANPTDMALRLVYADWLEERGDPRGEFLRLQGQIETMPDDTRRRELQARAEALRSRCPADWLAAVGGPVRAGENRHRIGWLQYAGRWLLGTLPPPEFAVEDPPDWLTTVHATGLPLGDNYTFRVQLWRDRVSIARSVHEVLVPIDRSPTASSSTMSAERAGLLLRLAEQAMTEPTPIEPTMVWDGLPCSVRLFRREPFSVKRQSWNLDAWPEREANAQLPAMVQLVSELFSMLH